MKGWRVPRLLLLIFAQVKAFRLLVNRSATWADWDGELLALELQEIQEADFDLSLSGVDPGEMDALLALDDDEQANAVPPLPESPVSRLGDLWLILDLIPDVIWYALPVASCYGDQHSCKLSACIALRRRCLNDWWRLRPPCAPTVNPGALCRRQETAAHRQADL
jgi:hypothetical protein